MTKDESARLSWLLKRCGRSIDRHIDQSLKAHAVARSQYRVLYYVARSGELTQKELLERLEIQGSTLTLIVDALVQKGWLKRTTDVRDRRVKQLCLTAKGRQLLEQIADPVSHLDRRLRAALSPAEARKLTILLQKTINILS